LSSGYSAGAFVTDERRNIMIHDEPLYLVTDHKISSVDQILPILETIAREGRPLIVIAEDVEGQALAALIMNAMRGTLKVAAIKAPLYGQQRRDLLDDLALSVGANFITRENGKKLNEVELSDLGTSKFVEATKYSTTVVGGSCDFAEIDKRIEALKAQIEQTESLSECEALQDRIVRLSSGVAVISVGGTTEVEMIEKKHRIEDALEAVKAAQTDGIVSGGGTALLRASKTIMIKTSHSDQAIGATIVCSACQEPFIQMAKNAGLSADILLDQVERASPEEGWDFRNNEMTDMLKAGIIDPVKVTKTALTNAASCAGTLITTNYGVVETEVI